MEVATDAYSQYQLFIYRHVNEYARRATTERLFPLAVSMFYRNASFMSVSYGYFYLS
ncbi:hypothetical protein [Psychrobacter sp. I-STPA10]|uniref:hypothetical protein n=1 Tax=Psychrobacter sp. I-STPA10 TaxID=2585769 RepID=UPI001E4C4062|nr:hypothetical protein [Psychrobacter sp. I-STPA10]